MTVYENKVFDPEKPWLQIPDTEENIMRDLEQYTLDPIFELYGNFVNLDPQWRSAEVETIRAGHALISGNFLSYSHAFRILTDDRALIARFSEAVKRNNASPAYQAARATKLAHVPVLEELTKAAGIQPGKYMFHGHILTITRVYSITEKYANEHNLLYLDRWEGRDSWGVLTGGAFHDGAKMPTTSGWKIYQETAESRYQIITYDSDGGGDDKRAYRTIKEAEHVAQGYINGTEPLSDGLRYEGAIIYDTIKKRIIREYGYFPDFARPNERHALSST